MSHWFVGHRNWRNICYYAILYNCIKMYITTSTNDTAPNTMIFWSQWKWKTTSNVTYPFLLCIESHQYLVDIIYHRHRYYCYYIVIVIIIIYNTSCIYVWVLSIWNEDNALIALSKRRLTRLHEWYICININGQLMHLWSLLVLVTDDIFEYN